MSKHTVNEKNLRSLGADQLARLLLSASSTSPLLKIKLRLELAQSREPYALIGLIQKALARWKRPRNSALPAAKAEKAYHEFLLYASWLPQLASIDPLGAIESHFDFLHACHNFLLVIPASLARHDECRADLTSTYHQTQSSLILLISEHDPEPSLWIEMFLQRLPGYGRSFLGIIEDLHLHDELKAQEGVDKISTQLCTLLKSKPSTADALSIKDMQRLTLLLKGEVHEYLTAVLGRDYESSTAKRLHHVSYLKSLGLNRLAEPCLPTVGLNMNAMATGEDLRDQTEEQIKNTITTLVKGDHLRTAWELINEIINFNPSRKSVLMGFYLLDLITQEAPEKSELKDQIYRRLSEVLIHECSLDDSLHVCFIKKDHHFFISTNTFTQMILLRRYELADLPNFPLNYFGDERDEWKAVNNSGLIIFLHASMVYMLKKWKHRWKDDDYQAFINTYDLYNETFHQLDAQVINRHKLTGPDENLIIKLHEINEYRMWAVHERIRYRDFMDSPPR